MINIIIHGLNQLCIVMAFPFLILDDIDDAWDEMKDTCPSYFNLENLNKFIN